MLARTMEARALVFFTPYRPWLLQKDLAFFEFVRASNPSVRVEDGKATDGQVDGSNGDAAKGVLGVRKLFEEVLARAMFEEDPGDETLKRTVFGYEIYWQDLQDHNGR